MGAPRNRWIVLGLVIAALLAFAALTGATSLQPYAAWLTAWSIVTFAAYAIDKRQARRHGWRIPEVALHGLALVGGSIGGWIGLLGLRHKTRHPLFPLVLAVALTTQIVIGSMVVPVGSSVLR